MRSPNKTLVKPDLPRPYKEVGERIKAFRISKKLPQTALMEAGFTKATISRVENGIQTPSLQLLQRLRELGADLNDIVGTGDQ